jgi:pentatricopeptide repeat protein
MLRSYTCRQCRVRLDTRNLSLRSTQWQSRATFISLSKGDEQTARQEAQAKPQEEPASKSSPSVGKVKTKVAQPSGPAIQANWEAGHPSFRPGSGHYSRYVQGAVKNGTGQSEQNQDGFLEQTGSRQAGDIVQRMEQHTRTISRPALQGHRSTHINAPKSYTAAIQKNLEGGNLHEAWTAFEKEFTSKDSPAFSNPSVKDARHMNRGSIFELFLQRTNEEFCRGAEIPRTPTEVIFHYEKIGIMQNEYWYQTISKLTHELLFAISGTSEPQLNSDALLAELTSVWRLFFQCNGDNGAPLESIAVEWGNFPDANTLSKPRLGTGGFKTGSFGLRLETFHSKCPSNATLGFCAVTYFNLFDSVNQDVLQVSDLVREQSAPFLRLLTHILAGSVVESVLKHVELSEEFQTLPEEFRIALIDQIKSAPSEAMLTIRSGGNAEYSPSPEERAANQVEMFRTTINKLILQEQNPAKLEQIWKEILQAYDPNNSWGNKPNVPEPLYVDLLTGFMTLFQPQSSIAVWNHMVASGIKPNVRTWTAMLVGCSKARDFDGFDTLWARFLKSGIKPDAYAWTTRVSTLIGSVRRINEGLAALDEMGKRWATTENAIKNPPKKLSANKGKKALPKITVNPYTKPTIEVVNGAITGFSRMRSNTLPFKQKKDYTQKVLQWAGNFGLKPDHITYNSLIYMYISGGDFTTSFKLIAQMEKEGISPDASTYTMLINSAFENQKFTDLSETGQSERVISIFDEMESGGVTLTKGIYGSVIDRLLKQYENFEAVRAVISHMMARNLQPTTQIYTALVTQYFQQSPPNIAAVDSLWLQILATMGTYPDNFFFDRIIEGYAQNNETSKMMTLLTRMVKEGKQPSWNALTAVVTALARAGDWENVSNVVRDVHWGKGVGKGLSQGMNSKRQRDSFFHFVVDKMGINLEQLGGGVGPETGRLDVRDMDGMERGKREELGGKNEGSLQDFGKGVTGDFGKQVTHGTHGSENMGEQRETEAQELWNEQLNDLGTKELKDEDLVSEKVVDEKGKEENWRKEDNGNMGGIPL